MFLNFLAHPQSRNVDRKDPRLIHPEFWEEMTSFLPRAFEVEVKSLQGFGVSVGKAEYGFFIYGFPPAHLPEDRTVTVGIGFVRVQGHPVQEFLPEATVRRAHKTELRCRLLGVVRLFDPIRMAANQEFISPFEEYQIPTTPLIPSLFLTIPMVLILMWMTFFV